MPDELTLRAHFLSVSAATPGSSIPSRNSSEAPPPVEMWVILSARPGLGDRRHRVAAADDGGRPAAGDGAGHGEGPLAERRQLEHAHGPVPDHRLGPRMTVAKASRAFGPMSSPIQPAGMAVLSAMRVVAAASGFSATT